MTLVEEFYFCQQLLWKPLVQQQGAADSVKDMVQSLFVIRGTCVIMLNNGKLYVEFYK